MCNKRSTLTEVQRITDVYFVFCLVYCFGLACACARVCAMVVRVVSYTILVANFFKKRGVGGGLLMF